MVETGGAQPSTDTEGRSYAFATKDDDWHPPSTFDALREINAHVGRQVTLLGFTIAVTSLLGVGPLKPAVQSLNLSEYWFVYLLLAIMATSSLYAAEHIYHALEPPIPVDTGDENDWYLLLFRKRRHSRLVSPALAIAIMSVVTAGAWTIAADPNLALLILAPTGVRLIAEQLLESERRRRFKKQFRRARPDASDRDEVLAWLEHSLEVEYGVKRVRAPGPAQDEKDRPKVQDA